MPTARGRASARRPPASHIRQAAFVGPPRPSLSLPPPLSFPIHSLALIARSVDSVPGRFAFACTAAARSRARSHSGGSEFGERCSGETDGDERGWEGKRVDSTVGRTDAGDRFLSFRELFTAAQKKRATMVEEADSTERSAERSRASRGGRGGEVVKGISSSFCMYRV